MQQFLAVLEACPMASSVSRVKALKLASQDFSESSLIEASFNADQSRAGA